PMPDLPISGGHDRIDRACRSSPAGFKQPDNFSQDGVVVIDHQSRSGSFTFPNSLFHEALLALGLGGKSNNTPSTPPFRRWPVTVVAKQLGQAPGNCCSKFTISIAVTAASKPLLPPLAPARLIACSSVSHVSRPKITGTPVASAAWAMPLAAPPAT